MAHFEPLVLSQTPKTLEINLSVVAGGLIFGFAMMPPCVVRFYTPAARYYATAPL
jgi:Na+(H+)/acetate symporter ActP